MKQVFFTGCTHFGHANIIKLAQRPFVSLEEMDEKLINNWNATVGRNDVIYHLGDFAFKDHLKYRERLNGIIVHVHGNHDGSVPWATFPYVELVRDINGKGVKFVLFHYPIEEWNGYYRKSFHLHCHTHSTLRWTAERRFNVTIEANNYRPVALDEIITSAQERCFL